VDVTIEKLAKLGNTFEEIVQKTEEFIKGMKTYFVLENLETLIKAGRVSRLKGAMAAMLSFRPIMSADGEGNIKLCENIRGTFNALTRLAEIVAQQCGSKESMVIAHCNNPERAQFLKEKIINSGAKIKEIIIVETAGLSTTYANNGGIVLAF
jgi:DegV family protein with EDD domain